MILVAGGTSSLGTLVVKTLVESGERVRVLTRDRERSAGLGNGVEVVTGDVRSSRDVMAAVHGCMAVVSAIHGFVGRGNVSPESIDRDGNIELIRAAKSAGVRRFVLVSVLGARYDHPMSLHRAKFAAEQVLQSSEIPFTIVRAAPFLETWIQIIGRELPATRNALVLGPGLNPITFVSVRDLAPLVARAAQDRSAKTDRFDVGGPETLDFLTIATRLIDASGKPGRVRHVPLLALRAMAVLARPFSPAFARQARAAVVMNTTDMTFRPSPEASSLDLSTTLGEAVRDVCEPPQVIGEHVGSHRRRR
jgi:NADH dehydrogenase